MLKTSKNHLFLKIKLKILTIVPITVLTSEISFDRGFMLILFVSLLLKPPPQLTTKFKSASG